MKSKNATFNFTGKKKINLENIRISGHSDGFITLDKLEIADLMLPSDAKVVIEQVTSFQGILRYEIGTVQAFDLGIKMPLGTEFFELVQFLIKVVSIKPGEVGKVLAEVKGIQPEIGGRPPSLLAIVKAPLGPLVWRMFIDPETGPELRINDQFADTNQILHNVVFKSVIIPEVVYQIALWTVAEFDLAPEEESPVRRWAKFFISWGFNPAEIGESNSPDDWARDLSVFAASRFNSFLNCRDYLEEDQ